MSAATPRLPLDVDAERDTRTLDALTARAIRLALLPRPDDEVAAELCALARGSTRVLDAAIARLERALDEEESRTVGRAVAALGVARARAVGLCLAS